MSDLKLALTYLTSRSLVTILTVASVALGLALATIVLLLARETRDTLRAETRYWDLAVGAKGSKLQLILNSLYYLDAPTGNIGGEVWEHLEDEPMVEHVVPVSMGDNFYGAPIVGTTPEFFADRTAANGGPLIADGRMFAASMEVVLGADIARRHELKLGDQVIGSHGWGVAGHAHDDNPYTVVGILAPTGASLDRALYTDYHSVWDVHAHHDHGEDGETGHGQETDTGEGHGHEHEEDHAHDAAGQSEHEHDHEAAGHDEHDHAHCAAGQEITTLLVRVNQPARRFQLAEEINTTLPAMAAVPVDEIDKLTATFIAPLQGVLLLVAYLVVLVSALSILISLYLTIHQRRRDVAIMRSLGATQADIFRLITLEAAALAGVGVVCGVLLGHVAIAVISPYSQANFGIAPHAWAFSPVELVIAVSVWLLGIIAGLLPAAVAYRLPVAETLTME